MSAGSGTTITGNSLGQDNDNKNAHSAARGVLPAQFRWKSTPPVILPISDATHELVSVKDPTVVRYNDRWHVYASAVSRSGVYNMVYASFADWCDAPAAAFYHMDQTAGFDTYVAAPQVFYFSPQKKWYLVFQSGPPMFSTSADLSDPSSWSAPAPFFATTPSIVTQNTGWLDFWVICDEKYCYLFFSDDGGRWYRSKTAIGSFPMGFDDPVIVMQDPEAGRLYEACNVYKLQGSNQYLALIEAFDSTSDYQRYFRSWTATSLDGPWTLLNDDGTAPFAGKANVTFTGPAWSSHISHGEMLRVGYDETMTIDASKLQYLYQGVAPETDTSDYNSIPWKIGLLTAQ